MKIIALVFLPLLGGCAALGGGADYTYSHIDKNGASCSVTVGSTRSLQGAGITITKDCELKAKADQATANEILAKTIADLVKKMQPIAVTAP